MRHGTLTSATVLGLAVAWLGCSPGGAHPITQPPPERPPQAGAQDQDTATAPPAQARGGPRRYSQVIPSRARTRPGLFVTHMVDDRLYFEIPRAELGREMMLITRTVESSQQTGGFFGGGPSQVVVWERDGNHILLRRRLYNVTADTSASIHLAVSGMARGPILGRFAVESWGPDSAAVVDMTQFFTTANADLGSLQNVVRDRSWIARVVPAERTVDVTAVQTGAVRPPGVPATQPAQSVTATMHWSMYRLAERPMMARLRDTRVGFISYSRFDYSRPEHRAEQRWYIRRHRLEKRDPAAPVSDPVEPIVYWIDAATPEWLKPWVKRGVDAWQEAFQDAGFSNAIEGRYAPSPAEDPDWSNFTLGKSIIYWRPSPVQNATGGAVMDPRSGEILKGEVNMYHNIMNLLRNWYFVQVSPLDPRGRATGLPDSLMGRLVEYVVAHEVGHAIGFPHNWKASYAYHADSVRNVDFLRRMGHVPTLMDYSRMNYVAQPEDSIPVDLLVPRIGPYDRYAVMWGYRPIPGARTPDEEWPTLDGWSRMQDTMPWLRFSTQDAANDPGVVTEAVANADVVYSTTLALRNLRRVAASLIPAAERPGHDYSELRQLYSNTVQQWGRYMSHVAALIGGADAQERYGTGPRFEPVSRERQQGAMRFLAENAFATPDFLVTPEILRRIEAEGVLLRLRTAQGNVVQSLISRNRMDRLTEYEALTTGNPGPYTVADLMGDLRRSVWTELTQRQVRVDVWRRNLQRAYLEATDRELNPPPPATAGGLSAQLALRARQGSDTRPVLRGELRELDQLAERALARTSDPMTRLHLRDVRLEIARILDPRR